MCVLYDLYCSHVYFVTVTITILNRHPDWGHIHPTDSLLYCCTTQSVYCSEFIFSESLPVGSSEYVVMWLGEPVKFFWLTLNYTGRLGFCCLWAVNLLLGLLLEKKTGVDVNAFHKRGSKSSKETYRNSTTFYFFHILNLSQFKTGVFCNHFASPREV